MECDKKRVGCKKKYVCECVCVSAKKCYFILIVIKKEKEEKKIE